jgi:hypothetical protein
MDAYGGDPRITIDENGADLVYRDGQPVMDQGLENSDLISLFTAPGWCGNILLEEDQRIGSDFEKKATGTLTLSKLALIENAARLALISPSVLTENIQVSVVNTQGSGLSVVIRRGPPGQDIKELVLSRNGLNWLSQANNPANMRL